MGLGATGGREAMCTVRAGFRCSSAAVRVAATVARTPSRQPAWRPRPPTDGLPVAASSTDPQGKTMALHFHAGLSIVIVIRRTGRAMPTPYADVATLQDPDEFQQGICALMYSGAR